MSAKVFCSALVIFGLAGLRGNGCGAFSPSRPPMLHRCPSSFSTRYAHRYWRRPPSKSATSSRLSDTNESESVDSPNELTPEKITELIEVSFVNACLQLAKGYVDVLKLFIVAVKAGFEQNIAPLDLIQSLDDYPHQSAGRALMAEEIKLRNTWIHVVYVVLDYLNHAKGDEPVVTDERVQSIYSPELLSAMRRQHDNGESFPLDQLVETYSFPNMDDAMEKAIVSQSLRVIWFTFTVLEEEEQCFDEKSGLKAQPPIPGAFE